MTDAVIEQMRQAVQLLQEVDQVGMTPAQRQLYGQMHALAQAIYENYSDLDQRLRLAEQRLGRGR